MTELIIFDNDPDRPLVERAASGDVTAFEKLVLQHKQSVFRTIFRITKVREDAEDQTQETFIRAYRYLASFRGNSKFKTWLMQIAVNQALMCLRKRRNDAISLVLPSSEDGEDILMLDFADFRLNPEQQWIRAQIEVHLEKEINRLPRTLRSAFILRCIHEYSGSETATQLGISVGAVKSRVGRAKNTIRERLNKSANASICA